MARDNFVRLSDDEMDLLDRIKNERFSEDTAYGRIVSSLINDKTLAEQKQILIVGQGKQNQYADSNSEIHGPRVRVISRAVDDGSKIRGFSPDLIILLTELPEDVMNRCISPMTATGADIIKLY